MIKKLGITSSNSKNYPKKTKETMNTYGISMKNSLAKIRLEEITRFGFTILKNIVPSEICSEARNRLDAIYKRQLNEFGKENMSTINENDMARCPLAFDSWFFGFLELKQVNEILTQILGDYHILNLQNGIINQPGKLHHQTSWHRDLPYQNWVSSRPLAINAMICIDNFNKATGGTFVLPHSHRFESFPSQEYVQSHETCVLADSGCVILFDAMLFHRAGANTSEFIRRGLNHLYTIPIIKQQVSIPQALKLAKIQPPNRLTRLLGYNEIEPESVLAWRKLRLERKKSKSS